MPMDDLADRVRAHAQRVADKTQPIRLADIEAHRVPRISPPTRRVWIAVVAAVTVFALAVVVLVAERGSGRGGRVAAKTRITAIAPAPLAARAGSASVWTGRILIVWGGLDLHQLAAALPFHAFGDGAAYDPRTDRWRRIAPSPLAPRTAATAIWTGHAMFVWGGFGRQQNGASNSSYTDGALYDPVTDRWRRIPDPPLQSLEAPGAVWTGREVIVFGGGGAGQFGDGAAFNPTTGHWRALSASPLPAGWSNPVTIWTGGEMIVVADTSQGKRVVAYRPDTNRWRQLPDPPPQSPDLRAAVWNGHALLLLSPEPSTIELGAASVAYLPGEPRWRVLAEPPPAPFNLLGGPPVWTGREALFLATDRALAYDPTRNTWRVLPGFDAAAHRLGVKVWAGNELLVWGGLEPGGVGERNDGARYIPSAPPARAHTSALLGTPFATTTTRRP